MGRPKKIVVPEPGNEAAVNEAEVPVVIKLAIPPDLYTVYESLSAAQGLTPAELMLHRLRRCSNHSSIRSLYFTETQVRQLESLLQRRPIETTDQALLLISKLVSVQIGDFEPVQLSAEQVKRIHIGAYGGQTPQSKLEGIVKGAISKAVGV